MKYDQYGQAYTDEKELCDLLYLTPELDLGAFQLKDASQYNISVESLYADLPKVQQYIPMYVESLEEFDRVKQLRWSMPMSYHVMDIAQYILGLCKTEEELQRVGQELLLYQERDLFNLLRYLKYFVDTMRDHKVVWGLGRGSSVASYVLFLLGVHRINSIYYDLPIEEFLK